MTSHLLKKEIDEIKIFFFLLTYQVSTIFLLSIEFFKEAIVLTVFFLAFLGFLYPILNIFLLVFISLAIEGKLIENFILFRFLGFNWYLMDISLFLVFLNLIILIKNFLDEVIVDRLFITIIAFILIALFSAYQGMKNGHQFQSVFYDFRGFFYYLSFIPAIVYLNSKERIIQLLFFVLIIISLKSIVDIYLSLFIYEKTFDIETRQMLGFARLTGYNEIVYSLSFIGSFFLFFFSDRLAIRFFSGVVISISIIALFLSYTRGSWISAAITILIGLTILFFSRRGKINYTYLLIMLFFVAIFFFVLQLLNLINLEALIKRIQTISFRRIDISNLGRLVEYSSALEAFYSNPIFGTGLGFLFVYFSPGIGPVESIYCHNSYLYILSKMGIVGIFPFVLILVFSLIPLIKIRKVIFNDFFYSASFIFLMILLAIAVKSLTTWHLNTNTFSLFVGILFGLSIRIRDFLKKDYGRQAKVFNK